MTQPEKTVIGGWIESGGTRVVRQDDDHLSVYRQRIRGFWGRGRPTMELVAVIPVSNIMWLLNLDRSDSD